MEAKFEHEMGSLLETCSFVVFYLPSYIYAFCS